MCIYVVIKITEGNLLLILSDFSGLKTFSSVEICLCDTESGLIYKNKTALKLIRHLAYSIMNLRINIHF